MVEVSNKHKSITVSVSSNNGNTVIAASSDTSQYWANQSHTFADQAKESVQEVKNYAELANSYIEGFQDVVTNSTNNIIATSNDCINQLNTTKEEAVENVNSAKTTIINDIEFVADGEKKEIEDLADLIKENAEEIASRTSFAMFDTILKDHVLTYEESKGLALQGTYVYKEAVAGSRYGYADFYEKCLEEYNESVGERWEQPVLSANGVLGGNTFAVSADGEANNNLAYKMFDNDNSTYWYGRTNGKGYVILYNPTPLNIVNLKITNSQWVEDSIATGEILVSNNGTDWAKILTFTGNTASNATWEIDLSTNSGFYKYYKINILSLGNPSHPPAIVNLEIITGKLVKNANGHLFYDIADKDIIDSIFESTGMAWFYGIDTENERIFLPRNNYFEQVTGDVNEVGECINAGLPNLSGTVGVMASFQWSNGAFYATSGGGNYGSSGLGTMTSYMDASRQNSIYGNSDTVQPNAVKKLLYICVGNTVSQSTVTDVVDVTTTENDTIPLFTGMYFDFTPNNVSWLKAGQQSNSGGVYTFCYNELVNELTNPKYGLKVINEADMIAGVDYSEYWKVNQDDMTFITPTAISNKALSGAVVGNGMTLGLTNGINDYGLVHGLTGVDGALGIFTGNYGNNIASSHTTSNYDKNQGIIGVTTDTTKSGIIAEQSSAQLYFKVANAVQNLELLDAGKVMEAVNEINANALTRNNKEEIISWGMPDFSSRITIPWDVSVQLPCDALVYHSDYSQSYTDYCHTYASLDNTNWIEIGLWGYTAVASSYTILPKGIYVKCNGGNDRRNYIAWYAPLKGAN